jgi:beta-lactamase class A
MRQITLACVVVALLGAAPSPSPSASSSSSPAQPAGIELARSRVDTMLRTGHADPAWFSASFLAQIPASYVDQVIAGLTKRLGAYQSVEFTPEKFVAHFSGGTDDVLIHLDADSKIDGLLFRPPVVKTASLDEALRSLARFTGTVSYVIVKEGRSESAALNPSASLAVGSAFKLAVLNALLDEVRHGSRQWNQVVPLAARWKSLPSGILRTWPNGTPLTLATYAAEMISISDNTAADALVRLVGPDALKPYAAGNDPFLTTREVFTLKSDAQTNLREAYLTANTPAARAAVLKRVDSLPLPRINQIVSTPFLGIEWHYSVRQLCSLMQRVAEIPLMTINPGLADASSFRHAAFKGGSDFGIINLTTMVTTQRGTRFCFSATLNDAKHAIDEQSFESAYGSVLPHLAQL